MPPIQTGALGEVARLFFKLGLIAFGGPAAHTAMMREEGVRRRIWTTDDEFMDLVQNQVDILFANEQEIISLYEAETFDAAMQSVREHCEIVAVTRAEKGAVITTKDEVHIIDAEPIDTVVDTTGAGDLFAAGFLMGHATGRSLPECGRMAGITAAEAISHMGARPETDLRALMKEKLV